LLDRLGRSRRSIEEILTESGHSLFSHASGVQRIRDRRVWQLGLVRADRRAQSLSESPFRCPGSALSLTRVKGPGVRLSCKTSFDRDLRAKREDERRYILAVNAISQP
jgi:hypothetical protein